MSLPPEMRDYTAIGQSIKQQDSVLRQTYRLLAVSFLPAIGGAYLSLYTNLDFITTMSPLMFILAFFGFFYGLMFLIEKNRHNKLGVALLMVLTFGLGFMTGPMLQYALATTNNGAILIGTAMAMTAAVFLVMSLIARNVSSSFINGLGNFLTIGAVVLMVGIIANIFLQISTLALTLSGGFVIFSSLLIMWQTRRLIDGGETSAVSATLTLFVSIYNLFTSLLHILLAVAGER